MRDIQGQADANATTLGEVERERRKEQPGGRGVPDERRGVNPNAEKGALQAGQERERAPDEDALPDLDPTMRE